MAFAIDPDETREVEVDGVTFTIGHIPMGIYRRLLLEDMKASDDARRRILLERKRAGEAPDPDEVERAVWMDPDYRDKADSLGLDQIRWAVRGHRGLCFADGREVPFETAKASHAGGEFSVVGPATLRVYEANPIRLMRPLLAEIATFNSIGDHEKKASPPPSSSTAPSTDAATASERQG